MGLNIWAFRLEQSPQQTELISQDWQHIPRRYDVTEPSGLVMFGDSIPQGQRALASPSLDAKTIANCAKVYCSYGQYYSVRRQKLSVTLSVRDRTNTMKLMKLGL
jgi:hypothetical protein